MMGKYLKTLSLLCCVLAILFVVLPVFAEESTTVSSTEEASASASSPTAKPLRTNTIKERVQNAREKNIEIKENLHKRASEAAQKRKEKLSEARLKLCEARAKNIGNHLKNMHARAKVIHTGHAKIFTRVDKFYNEKLVPNGYTLPNYADLKAEVEANKANVIALHDSAKATGLEFDCSSEDPKGQVDAFKEDMKALIEANKAYKESVKVFVEAVRDLAKTAKVEKVSPSPTTEAVQ